MILFKYSHCRYVVGAVVVDLSPNMRSQISGSKVCHIVAVVEAVIGCRIFTVAEAKNMARAQRVYTSFFNFCFRANAAWMLMARGQNCVCLDCLV